MPKFSAALPTPDTVGDFDEMCLVAGGWAARIIKIQPAGEIVHEMMTKAELTLRALAYS
jgi:enoyl-[acyl-carrier protein] reductase II